MNCNVFGCNNVGQAGWVTNGDPQPREFWVCEAHENALNAEGAIWRILNIDGNGQIVIDDRLPEDQRVVVGFRTQRDIQPRSEAPRRRTIIFRVETADGIEEEFGFSITDQQGARLARMITDRFA